ncbi:hypothetical protein B488_04770 [Liberibacter crescens BT-1]|uniref:Uncharacterized protein n=1 Tax=Liberibacter crescens (strain BT-1) TaxID=1215343 RepID=L0ESI5_LIBCB|nr:hypothetical protein B488_04770 [Liberibacter crescens BT-1]
MPDLPLLRDSQSLFPVLLLSFRGYFSVEILSFRLVRS